MTAHKIFLGNKDQVLISCAMCNRAKSVDTSKINNIHKPVLVRCACGHSFSVVFEKRGKYRKTVSFPGSYSKEEISFHQRLMIVRNLSKTGIGFITTFEENISEGDILNVEFTLDNEQKTVVRAKVIVRYVSERYIGAEFSSLNPSQQADLGFYLLP